MTVEHAIACRTAHAWEVRRARRSIALTGARIAYERADGPCPSSSREAIAKRAALGEIVKLAGRRHDAAIRRLAAAIDARSRAFVAADCRVLVTPPVTP